MKNNIVIDALEKCKSILITELKAELRNRPGMSADVNVTICGWHDDYEGNWGHEFENVTNVRYVPEDDAVFVQYEGYIGQYEDSIEQFNVGEIAEIIDDL